MFFDNDFFQRINLSSICEFLPTGCSFSPETGTPAQRHSRYSDALDESLCHLRQAILAIDWDHLEKRKREFQEEELLNPVRAAKVDLNYLYFEMGLLAGLRLFPQLHLIQMDSCITEEK